MINSKLLDIRRGNVVGKMNPFPLTKQAVYANRIYELIMNFPPVNMYFIDSNIFAQVQENMHYNSTFDEKKISRLVVPAYLLGLNHPFVMGSICPLGSEYRLVNIHDVFNNTWNKEISEVLKNNRDLLPIIHFNIKEKEKNLIALLDDFAKDLPKNADFFSKRISQLF